MPGPPRINYPIVGPVVHVPPPDGSLVPSTIDRSDGPPPPPQPWPDHWPVIGPSHQSWPPHPDPSVPSWHGRLIVPPLPLGHRRVPERVVSHLPSQQFMGVRPKSKKKAPWPLFRYGVERDCMHEFELKEKIYVRVFRNLVECVVMEGVTSDLVGTLAFLLCHVEANIYVNQPKPDDIKHLVHIGMISKEKRKISDVAKLIATNVHQYPAHFVVETRFHTKNSYLNSHFINKHTLGRIMDKIKSLAIEHVHQRADATL